MAGLKLKSGADFCNFEAFRMRLHNAGEDPTSDFGVGQIYFNTSDTSVGSARHVRLYDGTKFRSLAYLDEIAKNEAFLALKDKVDTLIGDGVDMDGIIESWKEVEAFLSGMSDTKNLMDLLNGKLDKDGGKAKNLAIVGSGTSYLAFESTDGTSYGSLGISSAHEAKFWDGAGANTLLHSGNYSDYALPLSGGTMTGDIATKSFSSGTDGLGLYIEGKSTVGIRIQYNKSETGNDYDQLLLKNGVISWNNKPLLHSGNVGEYAVKGLNIQTSSDNTRNLFSVWRGNTDADGGDGYVMDFNWNSGNYKAQIYIDVDPTHKMALRQCGNDSIWTAWKTIAFTDSNVAGATYLVDANGKGIVKVNSGGISILDQASTPTFRSVVEYKANNLHFGYDNMTSAVGYDTYLNGKNVYLRYSGGNTGLILNSSGNVTIGSEDKAGTAAKLYVDGHIKLGASGYLYKNDKTIIDFAGDAPLFGYGTAAAGLGTKVYGSDIRLYYGGTTNVGFILNNSGNVTIGGSDLAGSDAKLYVDGVAKFKQTDGTIINLETSVDSQGGAGISFFGADGFKRGTITASSLQLNAIGGGNVLIGTTEDDGRNKLQVAGHAFISNTVSTGSYFDLNRSAVTGVISDTTRMAIEMQAQATSIRFSLFDKNGVWKGIPMEFLENGDVHVSGNLIVDGEVSAGGAAEEGGNAGGGGAFHSESIAVGATQTTIAHGLGTDDIVVSIYEKDGVSGRWSIILTDVEIVDANNIIVSFGSATSVEHKVVIMGAVA